MKTGMEWALLGLLLLIVLAIGLQTWNSVQVELSADQVSALAAGQQLPAGFLTLGELGVSWIVKAVIGTFVGGLGLALGYKGWEWFRKRNRQKNWQSGPNANYQRQGTAPRMPSDAELLRLAMYQQMAANGNRPPQVRMTNDDEEPNITF
jgi:hypothetical protein